MEGATQQSYSYSLAGAVCTPKQTLLLPLQYKLAMPDDQFIFSSSWLPSPRFELRTLASYTTFLETVKSYEIFIEVDLYSGSRIYNHLPLNIKILFNDVKRFKSTLRRYLIEHTFYSLDKYYQLTS
jgi:hypothetical protein